MRPPIFSCKVLLVTGGQKSDFTKTASTEILSEASSMWTLAQPLPSARSGLRIAHVDGRILAIGDLFSFRIFITRIREAFKKSVTNVTLGSDPPPSVTKNIMYFF